MNLPLSIKEIPFFRIITPYLAGVILQNSFNIFRSFSLPASLVLITLFMLLLSNLFASRWRFRWVFGFIVNVFLLLSGMMLTIRRPNASFKPETNQKCIVFLLDKPQTRTRSYRTTGEIQYFMDSSGWRYLGKKVMFYFDLNDTLVKSLTYGSVIVAEVTPKEVALSNNPYQFDFKKYLYLNDICYTSYINPDQWKYIDQQGNYFRRKAVQLSEKLINCFKESGLTGDELAVATALTIGYKELLDDELKKVYSASGTMHILAVSGLHVGILYYLITFSLFFLNKNRILKILKALLILFFLWFFAILTGLSPSVERAALMFSFVVIGDNINRKTSIYNSICASAFLLLLVDPYNFYNIGFQLSYMAVISIVLFYPIIFNFIFLKNKILSYIWSLVAVTIAAQIGTFSLSLYYFHQFPNLFLISNLFAIPLSTLIIYLSVALIIFSPITQLTYIIGKILMITISGLNHGLSVIEKIPSSVTNGLNISGLQVILILLLIICITYFFLEKKKIFLFTSLGLIICLLSINTARKIDILRSKELVIFNIPQRTLIVVRNGNDITLISNDSLNPSFNKIYGFHAGNYLCHFGRMNDTLLWNLKTGSITGNKTYIRNKDLLILKEIGITIAIPFGNSISDFKSTERLKVDMIIVNNDSPLNLLNYLDPRWVILDSSLSKRKHQKFERICQQRGVKYYSVYNQGAYVSDRGNLVTTEKDYNK